MISKIRSFFYKEISLFVLINFLVSLLIILSIPNILTEDFIARIERINIFLFSFNDLEILKSIIGKCEVRGSWFQTFEPCYNNFDDGLRLKFYLNNLIFFLIPYTIIYLKYEYHRETLKCLIIFPTLILFLSTSLHESNTSIILLFFFSLRDNFIRITIFVLLILIGDIEFLIPTIIFLTLDFFFNKKIKYGLVITFLLLLSKILIIYLAQLILEHRNIHTIDDLTILHKLLEIIYSNSVIGENNIILNRIIYVMTEIIGNFQASILVSTLFMFLLIFYLLYKNFKSVIKNTKFLTLFFFIIVWVSTLWNYTDIRFYPFLVITTIQLIIVYFDKTKLKIDYANLDNCGPCGYEINNKIK